MKNLKSALKIGFIFASHVISLKRTRSYCCIFLMILGLISGLASSASAVDFIAGIKGGYFIWDPYLEETGSGQFKGMTNGTGALYGPVFSAMFTHDLSFSLSGLFGQQSAHWKSEDFLRTNSSNINTGMFSFDVTRYDVDSALSYRITDNFKIFAGYKYQYTKIIFESVLFQRDGSTGELKSGEVGKIKIKLPYNGPAIGVGFSAPIGEKLFFASNLSFLYMWGKMDFNSTGYYYDQLGTKHPEGGGEMSGQKIQTRGINVEPSIGASIGEGLPIVTLGVRFQWTQVKFVDPPSGSGINSKWSNDYLYGIFVSVLYPF